MRRPRLRFDQIPLWPVPFALIAGGGLMVAAYALSRVAELVDDAQTFEGEDA